MTVKINYPALLDVIGNTPLVRLQKLSPKEDVNILVKLEFLNPGFSVKDRIVKYIIDDAEKRGKLKPGGIIIENTSGNTGASAAMIAAIRGYKAILTMPDKVSKEKQNSLKAYGAKIIICPTDVTTESPKHYVNVAKKLAEETPNSFRIDQYDNPKNPEAHYSSTGREIWDQTSGTIDCFIASASTGGTISGTARFLKEKNPKIKIMMPDPVGSVYYEYFRTGKIQKSAACTYKLEGVGEDHLTKAIDFSLIDEVIQVSDAEAFSVARDLATKEGILAGGSSGANVWAAIQYAKQLNRAATIVTVLPDSGIKYLSKIYDDDWMREQRFIN